MQIAISGSCRSVHSLIGCCSCNYTCIMYVFNNAHQQDSHKAHSPVRLANPVNDWPNRHHHWQCDVTRGSELRMVALALDGCTRIIGGARKAGMCVRRRAYASKSNKDDDGVCPSRQLLPVDHSTKARVKRSVTTVIHQFAPLSRIPPTHHPKTP